MIRIDNEFRKIPSKTKTDVKILRLGMGFKDTILVSLLKER
jgi:hypothetical protein